MAALATLCVVPCTLCKIFGNTITWVNINRFWWNKNLNVCFDEYSAGIANGRNRTAGRGTPLRPIFLTCMQTTLKSPAIYVRFVRNCVLYQPTTQDRRVESCRVLCRRQVKQMCCLTALFFKKVAFHSCGVSSNESFCFQIQDGRKKRCHGCAKWKRPSDIRKKALIFRLP